MKSSSKSSYFNELNNALKTNKKSQNKQKILQSQPQQNNLYFRSSSQAQNILLQSSNHNNIDIFSQRNSNANLKLQQNTSSKLQKKFTCVHIKKNSIDKNTNQQSPIIQSPRAIENEGGCQTSGRKNQQLNISNSSVKSTSVGNTKQILGQIKFSLAKSKQKTNSSTVSSSQVEFQLNGGYQQNNKNENLSQKFTKQIQKNDSGKMTRTKSTANINSPNQYSKTDERTSEIQFLKNTGSKEKIRYADHSYDQDIDMSLDGKISHYNGRLQVHYNDKENLHSNIQNVQQRKSIQNERYDNQKRNSTQDSFIGKQDLQKQLQYSFSQQLLLKKKSEGYIDSNIVNNQISQLQQYPQNSDSFHDKKCINQNSNSITFILGRPKSQDKIASDKDQLQDSIGHSQINTSNVYPIQFLENQNLANTNQSQINQNYQASSSTQSSVANMIFLLAQSANNNQSISDLANNNNNSFNNTNASSSMKKSGSKANLFQQKSPPQTCSQINQSTSKLNNNQNQNIQSHSQSNKQNNSLLFQKNNNSFNLTKSNSSFIKNNQLNFSRGNAEIINENINILFTDNSFVNNQKQQNLQNLLVHSNMPTNSFYRVASNSSINGRSFQTPAREYIDNQNSNISDFQKFNQFLPQQKQQIQQLQQQQIQPDTLKQSQQKLNVDEYKKATFLQSNKKRKQDQQNGNKNQLKSSDSQNISNLFFQNNTSNYQNTSNNVIINTQNDTQDGCSFFKYANNQNYLFDCKTNTTDTSYGQLGSSSTQKRILNQSNKLNLSHHHQTQQQNQQNQINPIQQQQKQQLQKKQSNSPKRKNSTSYIEKHNNMQTNSSLSSFYQSGFLPAQNNLNPHKIYINGNQNTNINQNTLNSNYNNNSNTTNNQNILVSQYVQNFNATRTASQQSETNFTFQNNSQNPSQFALLNNNTEFDVTELKDDNLNHSKGNNINNPLQNLQQLDKYATSQFQVKTQEDEQQNENIYRRSSQQIQSNQSFQQNQNSQNQKNFSVLFNNLFNNKEGNKNKNDDSHKRQYKILSQIKRNNSNSLISTNPNIISSQNNVLNPRIQTDHSYSPQQNKNIHQNQIQQINFIEQHHNNQNNSKQQLKHEFNEQNPINRGSSSTQFNFNNQFDEQLHTQDFQYQQNDTQQIQAFDKSRSKSSGKQSCIISPLNLDKLNVHFETELQQKTDQQLLQERNKQNITAQNQNNNYCLENQMKQIQIKMKNKLLQFKASEDQWKDEKSQLLKQLESLQYQINFLTEENSLFKKSVSCNRQYDKQLNTSVSSSMEAVLQNF